MYDEYVGLCPFQDKLIALRRDGTLIQIVYEFGTGLLTMTVIAKLPRGGQG